VASVRFPVEYWTVDAALKWLRDHDFRTERFEPALDEQEYAAPRSNPLTTGAWRFDAPKKEARKYTPRKPTEAEELLDELDSQFEPLDEDEARSNPSTAIPYFLENEDAAFQWADKNVDHGFWEEDDDKNRKAAGRDILQERASQYSEFCGDAYAEGEVRIFRAVRVPVNKHGKPRIQYDNLGTSWSAEERGAQVQGSVPYKGPVTDVIIEAVVSVDDIDWEFGYTSFVYYGEDQWEVAVKEGSDVRVEAVDGIHLKKPLLGNVGDTAEHWSG